MSVKDLLQETNLPHNVIDFSKVDEKYFLPALEEAIQLALKRVEAIKENKEAPNFQNTIEALETSSLELDRVQTIFYNLFSAEASDSLQELAPKVAALSSNYSSDVLLDQDLYKKIETVYKQEKSLTGEPKMLLENTYKSFVRNGANLGEDKKLELRKIDEDLASLGPKFSENVLKETNAFEMILNSRDDLKGLPENLIEAMRELALEKGIKKENQWILTLDAPLFVPFLKFSERRDLREKVWRTYQGRCNSGEFDNKDVIKSIVSLRHKRAKLLGFESHGAYVLEERMAKTPLEVNKFLDRLLVSSIDAAKRDLAEVADFAKGLGFDAELKPWDFSYYSEKLKKAKYNFDEEELRPYFSVDKCIRGAFVLAEKLFNIQFKERTDLPTYHADVKTYEVFDASNSKFVGVFYADFFPRSSKRGGAWMTSYKSQGWNGTSIERPHVSIVCNFTKPTKSAPSLLSFDEVETLFHEFGHSLHGLLSDCKYRSLAGTNVYWDFVELPSQFMENWLLEKEVLDLFAEHYKTGEKVPSEYIEKLQKGAKFQSGYNSLRQLNFALLDMAWHGTYQDKIDDVAAFEQKATEKTSLFPREEGVCSSTGFSHIFAGGYSAGYYSYKWAEVLDADAFAYFKENDLFNSEIAESFKKNILSKGGSEHPEALYEKFRGRAADPDSLLRRDGLI